MLKRPLPADLASLGRAHSDALSRSGPLPALFPITAPDLAVIIPTLDECDNVGPLLSALEEALDGRAWEAIFVDDGSRDGTVERIEHLARHRANVRLIRRFRRRGLSSAILEGMMATIAPVVAVIDADLQHDEAILPALADAIGEGADIAVGTRYAGSGSTGDWCASRARVSAIGTRLARSVTRTACSDPLSGFFAVRRSLVLEALPRLSAVGFKLLLDLLASAPHPVRVTEVPYRFRCRQAGRSKLDSAVALEYLLLLLDKTVGRWIPPRFILFLAVGASGLVVNLALLGLLIAAGMAFGEAETIAVLGSILSNFALNNLLTYRDRRLTGRAWLTGLATFYIVCGIGAVAQIGAARWFYADRHVWWAAGVAGAAVAAAWNYAASAFLTWRKP